MTTASKTRSRHPLWQFAAEFMDGFTKPSRLAAAVALVSFLVTAALALWMFSPSALVGRMGDYLPRSSIDAEGFATVEALRLADTWVEGPTLIAFGSSTIAQALGDGRILTDTLRDRVGQDWSFLSLTTPQQSPFDQLALLETVLSGHRHDGPPVIVLLSASGLRLSWTPQRLLQDEFQNRIGLQSEWVRAEKVALGTAPPPSTGFYIIDNLDFICLNGTEAMLRALINKPVRRHIDAYNLGPDQGPGNRANPILRDRYLAGQDNVDFYLGLQLRMIERLRDFDTLHIVLIDEPFAPDVLSDLGLSDLHQQSDALFAEFAAQNDIAYWPFVATSNLSPQDYHDPLHVYVGAPQDRLQRSLAAMASNYIERNGL